MEAIKKCATLEQLLTVVTCLCVAAQNKRSREVDVK